MIPRHLLAFQMTDAEAGGDFKMPTLPVAAKESEPAAAPAPKMAPPAPPQKKSIIAPPFEYTPPPFACDPDDTAGYRLEVRALLASYLLCHLQGAKLVSLLTCIFNVSAHRF